MKLNLKVVYVRKPLSRGLPCNLALMLVTIDGHKNDGSRLVSRRLMNQYRNMGRQEFDSVDDDLREW